MFIRFIQSGMFEYSRFTPSPVDGYLNSFQFSCMFLCVHLQVFLHLRVKFLGWYIYKLLHNDKLFYIIDPISLTTSKVKRGQDAPSPCQHFCQSGGYKTLSPCDIF